MTRRARACHAIAVVGVVLGIAVVVAHQSARDRATTPIGTATLSGTVLVSGDAKQPARHVQVTLNDVAHTAPGQTTTTDDAGAFAFHGVPAGRFELQATKSAYLTASYGASRPERPGTPIVVKDGDRISNLSMTIARGGVITGVVRDGRGLPLAGISVRVLRFGYNAATGERMLDATGERTLGPPRTQGVTKTDDRGEYRIYGLPPGRYLVLANSLPPGARSAGSSIPSLTKAQVDQALAAARTGQNAPGTPVSTPVPTSDARVNYAPVFYPGVADVSAATTIALELTEERRDADIVMQYMPTATVSGTVSLPAGIRPGVVTISLMPAGGPPGLVAGTGLFGAATTLRPDGNYMFSSVAPGTYTIIARGGAVPMWAAAEVAVNGQDVTMPLTLQPTVTISGHVVFAGTAPTPAELQTLSFTIVPVGSGGAMSSRNMARVDAQGRFSITGVTPDVYQFVMAWADPVASSRWVIKSSTANGRESFDAPLRVNANEPLDWTITLTDRPTGVTGIFQDRGGRAATDYYVLVFAGDRTYWTAGSRRIRMMRPDTDGAFSAKGLPQGEYFLAALADLEPGEWNDPALLDQIVGSAIKIALRDGEMTRQDIRVGLSAMRRPR